MGRSDEDVEQVPRRVDRSNYFLGLKVNSGLRGRPGTTMPASNVVLHQANWCSITPATPWPPLRS